MEALSFWGSVRPSRRAQEQLEKRTKTCLSLHSSASRLPPSPISSSSLRAPGSKEGRRRGDGSRRDPPLDGGPGATLEPKSFRKARVSFPHCGPPRGLGKELGAVSPDALSGVGPLRRLPLFCLARSPSVSALLVL